MSSALRKRRLDDAEVPSGVVGQPKRKLLSDGDKAQPIAKRRARPPPASGAASKAPDARGDQKIKTLPLNGDLSNAADFSTLFLMNRADYWTVCDSFAKNAAPLRYELGYHLRDVKELLAREKVIQDKLISVTNLLKSDGDEGKKQLSPDVLKTLLNASKALKTLTAAVHSNAVEMERIGEGAAKKMVDVQNGLIERRKAEESASQPPQRAACKRTPAPSRHGRKSTGQGRGGRRARRNDEPKATANDALEAQHSSKAADKKTATNKEKAKGGVAQPTLKRSERIRKQNHHRVASDRNDDASDSTTKTSEESMKDGSGEISCGELVFCSCQQPSYGHMIMCENLDCPFQWYHFTCVRLTNTPRGDWYCPSCRDGRSNKPKKGIRKRPDSNKSASA